MGMKLAQDHHQQALKCPRCDSSNTKFCYYNNYSLSQPRHFCKACKRYWTRGGTLRSVPVGGGCRKNKRMKRPSSVSDRTISTFHTTKATTNQIGVTSASTDMNPVFYGLQLNNQSDNNHTFPRFNSCTGYDVDQSQFNAFKTGFSSVGMASSTQIHDVMASNTNLLNFSSFQSSTSNHYQTMIPVKDLLIDSGCGGDLMTVTKKMKIEDASDLINNNEDFVAPCFEQMSSLDSSVYWSSLGAWPDPSNYEYSATSLI